MNSHWTFHNVNEALTVLPEVVLEDGLVEDSRNGPVVTYPEPMMVTIASPRQRVSLCPVRRANPFLFLLDGLSILTNVNFVKPFADIVPRFMNYSDDGVTLRAHYGKRLYPQIQPAIHMLIENPKNRRVVLQIWNADFDLGASSKDIPCNLMVNLRVVHDHLDLTVFNRSNDLLWGMLGANIVQFSFLQEYIANRIGLPVGQMHMISTNVHIYTESPLGTKLRAGGKFTRPLFYPPVIPLNTTVLMAELSSLFTRLDGGESIDDQDYRNPFLSNVVVPMLTAWKTKDASIFTEYPNCDWFDAGRMYLNA